MTQRTCSIDGCAKPIAARGWCGPHYQRWRRSGDAEYMAPTVEQRFWGKVDKSGECWIWTGAKTLQGYGILQAAGANTVAHRFAYEMQVGAIPEGYHIDHICHVASCVRVEHLRLATPKQNRENLAGSYSNSRSGVRGVCWNRQNRKWQAQVCHNGKQHYVGLFETIGDAEAAVIAKRNELFTHNILDRVT